MNKKVKKTKENIKKIKNQIDIKGKTTKKRTRPTFKTSEVILLVVITSIVSILIGGLCIYKFLGSYKVLNDKELTSFIKQYNYISENYIENSNKDELIDAAIKGMVGTLDNNSVYIDNTASNVFSISLDGNYYGIGIQVGSDLEERLIVARVFKDSPAEKAGLKAGDILLKFNDENLKEISTNDFQEKIKKQGNKEFTITYKRNSKEKKVTISSNTIILNSVFSKTYNEGKKKIGYMYISIFAENTKNQAYDVIEKFESKKIDGLIIDLRNNTGGHLSTASSMLDMFLEKNKIKYQIQTKQQTIKYKSTGNKNYDKPIVILVNETSASASEVLVAGLKQNLKNITIVGTKTYGKGTVQESKTLPNGNQYKITTKKWLTPEGKCIDKIGLNPDIKIEASKDYQKEKNEKNDNQLKKAITIASRK